MRYLIFLATAALFTWLDLWSKTAVFAELAPGEFRSVIPGWFEIVTSTNTGAPLA